MSRFADVLADADARLSVPEPARARILLEISADMEDLQQEYLGRGLSEQDAEAAVLEHFEMSEDTLRELVRVHDTPIQRSLQSIPGQAGSPWPRLLMVFLAILVTLASGTIMIRPQLYRDASLSVWAMMPLLVAGFVIASIHVGRLAGGGDRRTPMARGGLGRLLGLSVLIVAVAAVGLWIELYLGTLRIRNNPGETLIHLVGWLHMASATMVISLTGALVLGFLWFFLEAWQRRREVAAVANLLEGF
jgi:hypothetical protein